MDWALLARILMQVPTVVTGVETMVQGAKQGATKKNLAMAALGFATQEFTAISTNVQNNAIAGAVATFVSTTIDNWAALLFPIHAAPVTAPVAATSATVNAGTLLNTVPPQASGS